MEFNRSKKFDISDELFFRLFFLFSLIIFGSMMFFSFKYRLKKEVDNINNIEKIKKIEETKILRQDNLSHINCDSPVWKKRPRCRE